MSNTDSTLRDELKEHFKANMLDGDDIQTGQMLASTEVFDYLAEVVALKVQEADGCPCLLVEPCSYACTCASPTMSGGCIRCAKYGSKEQRIESANRLAALHKIKGDK